MQSDNDLNQLFRARLPIASLPKDFADRLTKAILDEVAHLRQSTPVLIDNHGDDPREFKAPPILPRQLLAKPTTTIILLLLINCYLGALLQGCSFTMRPPSSTPAFIATESNHRTIRSGSAHGQMIDKDRGSRPETVIADLTNAAHTLHLPPLRPLKPKLPILQVIGTPKIPVPQIVNTPDSPLVNLHGPPGTEQQSEHIITVTVLYDQSVGYADPPDTQVTPTALSPEDPDPVATPTIGTPMTNLVETPIPPSPTPVLNIFEPTTTPNVQEPTPTATNEPLATPTIFIRPLPTETVPVP